MKKATYEKAKIAYNKVLMLMRPRSRQVVELLTEFGEMTVTQLFIKMRCDQPVVSTTLANLKEAGVVKFDRDGKNIFYSIDSEGVEKINRTIKTNITWEVSAKDDKRITVF